MNNDYFTEFFCRTCRIWSRYVRFWMQIRIREKNDMDPTGSGSTTLVLWVQIWVVSAGAFETVRI
jgi:hypothetical protein